MVRMYWSKLSTADGIGKLNAFVMDIVSLIDAILALMIRECYFLKVHSKCNVKLGRKFDWL